MDRSSDCGLTIRPVQELGSTSPSGELGNERSVETEKKILADSWNVHSRPDLLHLLLELENGTVGQRSHYWTLFHEDGRPAETSIAGLQIAAWDFGRYINLCQWGFNAGYLTERETWDKILPFARLLQRSYSSWEEYAGDYLRGRAFWSPDAMMSDRDQYIAILAELLKTPGGYWATIPWNESFGEGPIGVDILAETIRRSESHNSQKKPSPQADRARTTT